MTKRILKQRRSLVGAIGYAVGALAAFRIARRRKLWMQHAVVGGAR